MPFPQLVPSTGGGGITTVANFAALPASAADGALYYLEAEDLVVGARTLAGWQWWLPPAWLSLSQIAGTEITPDTTTADLTGAGWTLTAGTGSITRVGSAIRVSGDINTRLQAPGQPTEADYIVLTALSPVSEVGGRAWLHNVRGAPVDLRNDVFGPSTALAFAQRTNAGGSLIGTAQPCATQLAYRVGYSGASAVNLLWCPSAPINGVPVPHESVLRSALDSGSGVGNRLWWIGSRSGSAVYDISSVALLDATGL